MKIISKNDINYYRTYYAPQLQIPNSIEALRYWFLVVLHAS